MTGTAARVRAYAGPAILSYGFRPFFLAGATWAVAVIAATLPVFGGRLTLPTSLPPIAWHAHELVFGFVPAIAAGFLLTAVPNWTGRLPVTGPPLLALVLAWLAGRLAVLASSVTGDLVAAGIDLMFLPSLAFVLGREIVAGNTLRNLKVIAVIGLLALGNAIFHYEHIRETASQSGLRLGVAAIVLLVSLIGGRIVPSFTRNWLAQRGPGRLPAPLDRIDVAAMGVTGAALTAWVVLPGAVGTALLAAAAFIANTIRLGRWAGWRTAGEPLVLVLHVAFAFIPLGFLLVALSTMWPSRVAPTGALHGWTAGAMGLMILAVMTRASLGHTGRPLHATVPIQAVYVAAFVAAVARVAAAFGISRDMLLALSAAAWIAAFGGFLVIYAPLLVSRRR